jgi:hypothetical protein
MTEITGLSETDASNTSITSANIAEGGPPSAINNAIRNLAGALARAYNRLTGKYASTGSANAYVLTPSVALPAYVTGERYSFRSNFANTGAATLNISSLGAKTLKKMTASGKADLAANDIVSGQPVTVEYDGTDLILVTPISNGLTAVTGTAPITVTGSSAISFDASYLRGYLSGLTLSNGTDATNDIDIAAGVAVDDGNAVIMKLASALTKRLDASWAVGTNQGGLDTGSIADTVYHLWLIRRSDTGVVDALFSTSASSPTMPANYDQKRRIGAVERVSSALRLFTQIGDTFLLSDPPLPVDATNPGTSAVTRTLTGVPTGVKVEAILNVLLTDSNASGGVYLSSLDVTDEAGSASAGPLVTLAYTNITAPLAATQARVMTNTSGQIRSRLSASGASTVLRISTLGWVDRRGRDG